MSLDFFDSTEYESRSLQEWLQLGGIADGGRGFLSAKCLLRTPTAGAAGPIAAWWRTTPDLP